MSVFTPYTRQLGVDSSADRLSLPYEYASFAVNRSFRGGVDRTRPPFKVFTSVFENEEDEYVITNGNVSGMIGYNSIFNPYQTSLVVAIGDSIFAAKIADDKLEWRRLFKGISAKWQMSFFCQIENLLVWQNGIDLPLYWDGLSSSMQYCKDAPGITAPMPLGNIMLYAHGRLFLATESNIVKVSKHIYGNGLATAPYGALDFGESEYWSDGDGFGGLSDFGQITGMGVIKRGSEINGHGPVIVFQQLGAFSIDPTIPRTEWISSQNIQQIVITGRGCSSPYSVVNVNGDLWFRCTDKTISSFRKEASKADSWTDTSLSKEVGVFTSLDSTESLGICFSTHADNRLLVSVGTRVQAGSSEFGYHRYALGIVSLDFDDGSTVVKDQSFSWDGIWTGIRPTGVARVLVGQQLVSIYGSFDSDNVNRFYLLSSDEGNDVGPNGESLIEWQRINERALYTTNPPVISTIEAARVSFFDAVGDTTISVSFRPDDHPCWFHFPTSTEITSKPIPAEVIKNEVTYINVKPLSGGVNFIYNCVSPQLNTPRPSNKAESFAIRINGKGAVSIRSVFVKGSQTQSIAPNEPDVCNFSNVVCEDEDDNYLSYLIK